jgi:hypothetical protein
MLTSLGILEKTYTKVLDLMENLIVEGEVIAGDDIDASLLLDVPVLKTKSLGLAQELSLGELAAPVRFRCLLQVPVDSHTRETEDRSAKDMYISMMKLCQVSAMVETHD